MTKLKRIILVLFIILSCVGCDQITKTLAKSHLPRARVLSFAGDTLRFDYAENKGAVLTFEHSVPEKWRGPTFTLAVAAVLALIIMCLLLASGLHPLTVIALSLIWGGIFSNLLDRVVLDGYVVDFLNMGWGAFRTGIFNMADVAISIGSCLLALNIIWNFAVACKERLEW